MQTLSCMNPQTGNKRIRPEVPNYGACFIAIFVAASVAIFVTVSVAIFVTVSVAIFIPVSIAAFAASVRAATSPFSFSTYSTP
jgi:hypothetical protein